MKKRERLFLIAFDIFLVGILLNSTKFNVIEPAIKAIHAIQLAGAFLAIFKILLDFIDIIKSKKKIKIKYLYLLFFLITLPVFYVTRSKNLVYLVVFILASKNVDFKKILRSALRTLCIVFIFVLLSCFFGLIDDLTVSRGVLIRHSYGWNSPNCMMLNIFEIVTIYLYLRKDNLKITNFIISFIALFGAYYFTNSRMGFFAGILLLIIFFLLKHTKISILYEKLKYLVYAIPLILTIAFLGLIFAYQKYELYELDAKFTGRLLFSEKAIEEYQIKPFGNKIKFVGQQFESEYEKNGSYNYVDNSYLKTLLNLGYIFTAYLFLLLIVLNKHAYKRKDYYLLSILVISEVYCFFDSWLLGVEFNPYLLLLGSYIYPLVLIEEPLKKEVKDNKKILSISVAAYNLEKLIKQNLDSFINSKYKDNLEIIVTDDESKDNTVKVVEEYTKKYPGIIKLVKQKNSGPGSTVNSGIKHANGKYFRMVDGDDRVNTSNLDRLLEYLSNLDADMIINDYDFLDDKTEKVINTTHLDIEPYKKYYFEDICDQFYLEMHNVIYKTDILKNKKIKLDNCYYTDVEYLLFPLPYIKTCMYIDESIYVYRINQSNQSVSFKSMQKNIDKHDLVLNNLIDFYKKHKNKLKDNTHDFILKRISNFADNQLVTLLTFDINKEQIDKIKTYNDKLYKKDETVFNEYKTSKKYKILKLSNYKLTNLLHKLIIKKASK